MQDKYKGHCLLNVHSSKLITCYTQAKIKGMQNNLEFCIPKDI